MKANRRRTAALGKLLDLCDDLQRIRSRIADPQIGRDERSRLRRQTRRKVTELSRNLNAYRFRGPLGRVLREHRFSAQEFEVMSVLLQRAVRAEEPEMEGRLILGSVFESSFGVLTGLHLLQEESRLRSSGLVTMAEGQERTDDVLQARFRLSEVALDSLRAEVAGETLPRADQAARLGYANHRALLVDLRRLHNHYLRRSERVFDPARWSGTGGADDSVGRPISRAIEAGWRRVRERLSHTDGTRELPLLRLMQKHGLGEAETMILVHLLFSELFEGEAFANTSELLRLVSASEHELIRNRRLFLKGSPLLAGDLVAIEPFVEGRELTGEVHLTDWTVNELLAVEPTGESIQPDERLAWHLYLRRMEDSSGFFRDLESS